ncbi:MAG TPA: HAD family phosphatase [Terriglobales bacterium]|nr:HAD family phosphatase [Terriglobales bacterium]
MGKHRAVLWDMDGTLIDSEELHWIAWQETMAGQGHSITREQFLSSFGQRNDTIISGWLGATATPELIEKIGDAKEKRYRDLVRKVGISPLPGVAHWIQRLHDEQWLQAIASAAPRLNVEVVLDAISAAHCFQAIVSAEDVSKGKPDPEVYLTAAAKVGAPPARCVVVEDAPAGIEGARRAGMRSIGVNHTGRHLDADVVVPSLDLLQPDVFERLLRR